MRVIQESLALAFASVNPKGAEAIDALLARGEKPSKIKASIRPWRNTLTGGCAEAYVDWKAGQTEGASK